MDSGAAPLPKPPRRSAILQRLGKETQMVKGRYSSSNRIFERRGDPWLSDREKRKDFDRTPETEDPDYDYSHRFHYSQNAKGKPKTVAPRDEGENVIRKREIREAERAVKGANILRKLREDNRAINVADNSPPVRFHPCPGCRKALCVARGTCLK